MKRRIFKQFLSGILGILLLLSLAGCGQSTSDSKPDDTMEAFYDLIIKQDTTSMTDLGIDDSEASDTLKTYQTSMISTLQKSFKNAGVTIKACSHITGGGFYENIPRMLPDGVRAVVKKDSYEVPAIFRLMQKKGNIADEMMYNTYNMGLGMVLALDPADVDKTLEALKAAGETAYVVGTCEAGEKGVTIC